MVSRSGDMGDHQTEPDADGIGNGVVDAGISTRNEGLSSLQDSPKDH